MPRFPDLEVRDFSRPRRTLMRRVVRILRAATAASTPPGDVGLWTHIEAAVTANVEPKPPHERARDMFRALGVKSTPFLECFIAQHSAEGIAPFKGVSICPVRSEDELKSLFESSKAAQQELAAARIEEGPKFLFVGDANDDDRLSDDGVVAGGIGV